MIFKKGVPTGNLRGPKRIVREFHIVSKTKNSTDEDDIFLLWKWKGDVRVH
jgi:hypothetical protein